MLSVWTCLEIYSLVRVNSLPNDKFRLDQMSGGGGWVFVCVCVCAPPPGEHVRLVMGGCEFNLWLRRTFFPAYFCLSPLQKHVRKVVGGFGENSCVSTGVRKPGNTYASPTAMI